MIFILVTFLAKDSLRYFKMSAFVKSNLGIYVCHYNIDSLCDAFARAISFDARVHACLLACFPFSSISLELIVLKCQH